MRTKYIKLGIFAFIGAVAGFTYYYFIGCYNGQCLISSNPYISTGYGAFFGLVLAWGSKNKNEDKNTGDQ